MLGGCGSGSPQAQWLGADPAQQGAASCTLAIGHHLRWASGSVNGDNPELQTFWRLMLDAGVDLYLAGHNHNMQRYLPLDADGRPDPGGLRQIIVGTGGRDISGLTPSGLDPEVEAFANTFGVLRLVLAAGTYEWSFISEPGDPQTDSGSAACVPGPANAPSLAVDDTAATPAATAVAIPVLDNDFDANGAGTPNSDLDPASVTVLIPPANGTAVPDPATGQITYTPNPGFSGDDPFTYQVADLAGALSDPATVVVTVASPPPSQLTFAPTDDTYVKETSPTKMYGARTEVRIDASSRKETLLRFDLNGIAGATVTGVRLRLYALNSSPVGGDVFVLPDTSWDEDTVTWNTAPAAGGLMGSFAPSVAGSWQEADVTGLVFADGPVAVRITSTSSSSADYTSKENANGFGAELIVELGGPPDGTPLTRPSNLLAMVHDVGTAMGRDERKGPLIDTPSLLELPGAVGPPLRPVADAGGELHGRPEAIVVLGDGLSRVEADADPVPRPASVAFGWPDATVVGRKRCEGLLVKSSSTRSGSASCHAMSSAKGAAPSGAER